MKKASIPETVHKPVYPSAKNGVTAALKHSETAQTQSPSYTLAFADEQFLLLDEMRPVRLQLEFQKPELNQQQQGIQSTIVVFGSSRIVDHAQAEIQLQEATHVIRDRPDDPESQRRLALARRRIAQAEYYEQARELARLVSSTCQMEGRCHFVVTTGGGPGIMEAANRGAHEVGGKSIGMNIVLPHEQAPNPYITPELCFQFHYFALRKMHFLLRAKALICFPGGYGTLDELFEALTLIQTCKVKPIPVLLFDRNYWQRLINFQFLIDEGMISPEDINIFHHVESAQEAWTCLCDHYGVEMKENHNSVSETTGQASGLK